MGYRIRIATEVVNWLERLRETDPVTADLVDEALALLRDLGPGLGPPLAVPLEVEVPARPTYLGIDYGYPPHFELLTKVRRGVADTVTARKRLDLQIHQQEQEATRLGRQIDIAHQRSRDDLADLAAARLCAADTQLAALREQRANVQSEEERLSAASQRLQDEVSSFRSRLDAFEDESAPRLPGRSAAPSLLLLSELRPGAPGPIRARVLFAVEPSAAGASYSQTTAESSGTAVLLAAGTERDWLDSWYAETIRRCRDRYERDQGGTG